MCFIIFGISPPINPRLTHSIQDRTYLIWPSLKKQKILSEIFQITLNWFPISFQNDFLFRGYFSFVDEGKQWRLDGRDVVAGLEQGLAREEETSALVVAPH